MTIKRLFFVTKIRSATRATKIIKNQGFVLKTIVVNLVLISPYGSNDLAHSLHSFVRTSISVNFGNIFELGQKNACCINVPNQKMILIYHISRQNKMRYSYSGSESSMPSEGLVRERTGYRLAFDNQSHRLTTLLSLRRSMSPLYPLSHELLGWAQIRLC
jgi:hypothetical protein